MQGDGCAVAPHVHSPCTIVFAHGPVIVMEGHGVAFTTDLGIAERIAVLLDRHGLVDVPDDVAQLTPWGPPTGPRLHSPFHPNPKLQR